MELSREYYVYIGKKDGMVVYVGKGIRERYKHLYSGISHIYEANRCHFIGETVTSEIYKDNLTNEEAKALELELIKSLNPVWNRVGTDNGNLRQKIAQAVSKHKNLENKSGDLWLLIMASKYIQDDGTVQITSKAYNREFKGAPQIQAVCRNFRSKRNKESELTPLRGVDSFEGGLYTFTFCVKWLDNISNNILGLRLTRKEVAGGKKSKDNR